MYKKLLCIHLNNFQRIVYTALSTGCAWHRRRVGARGQGSVRRAAEIIDQASYGTRKTRRIALSSYYFQLSFAAVCLYFYLLAKE